ncbi:MBL fold metallo-hydrolase [Caldilinea sp.]|uniref:MBL fold metallo-hydrolase n=1 Tax=Caldilinea sp. TaxID=2293560 RepID=UPI002CFA0017|nr:MBL fold metallo-hydrolase [Anaerolineales bacterium]HQY90565.1 MBL fold metallo-hydrolase [Caldilinea sp.]HRA69122.1 MBL fold metallo-hydrolase [Caldilinea sp.]
MIHVEQHGSVTVIRMARALLGRPLYWTAAYWLDGLLIDAGPRCTAHELVRVLDKVPLQQIAITHGHEDHIGGLDALLQRFPDVKVYAARQTLPLIEHPERLGMQRYRQLVWGKPRACSGVHSLDAVEDVIRTPQFTLRAIETPGHSRDHVSYFEPAFRWLFCGDAFIGGRDVAWAPEFDMFAIVSSLRTLASLRPERLFPGSGTVRRTPLPDLLGKIGDLIQLASQVQKLEDSGRATGEIVEMLFDGEPKLRWWTLGHFSAANLVEACRVYNDLTAPAPRTAPTAGRTGSHRDDLPDPPSNRSIDPDDLRR